LVVVDAGCVWQDGQVLTEGRFVRAAVGGCLVAWVVVALTGCSGAGNGPAPGVTGPTMTVDMVRAGLLRPTDVGSTWVESDVAPPTKTVVGLCAGDATATKPPVPGSPSVVVSSLKDEGDRGAQAFDQVGLVYADAKAAGAGLDALRVTAGACPSSVSRSAQPHESSAEAGYTESASVSPLRSGAWSGFVVVRHKQYEVASPGTADTAVAVLVLRNVVVVAGYAVYWVGSHTTGPNFTTDWQRLVDTVLSRVDPARGSPG
jgi:hypothetical protein